MKIIFRIFLVLGLAFFLLLGFFLFYSPGPVWKDGSY
jgi:hypothetical protein